MVPDTRSSPFVHNSARRRRSFSSMTSSHAHVRRSSIAPRPGRSNYRTSSHPTALTALRRSPSFVNWSTSMHLNPDLSFDQATLDYLVGDVHIECHRDYLRVDDQCVRVLTLRVPPA